MSDKRCETCDAWEPDILSHPLCTGEPGQGDCHDAPKGRETMGRWWCRRWAPGTNAILVDPEKTRRISSFTVDQYASPPERSDLAEKIAGRILTNILHSDDLKSVRLAWLRDVEGKCDGRVIGRWDAIVADLLKDDA